MPSRSLLLLCLVLWLIVGVPALAQNDAPTEDEPKEASAAAAIPAGVGTGEVQLKVVTLGVGGRARGGDWTGIQVDVTDNGSKVRDVLIRMALPDADGDTTWIERAVTANPGSRQSVWLYARLPSGFNEGVLRVSAYEALPGREPEPGRPRSYRAGRLLGAAAYVVNNDLRSGRSLVGVVGSSSAGLEQYMWPAVKSPDAAITGHEHTELAVGLSIANLPDRWLGLAAFETLVWTGNDPALHQPGQLKAGQPEAIREWVRRGGHLIVVLPPVGQTWYETGAGSAGLLSEILPPVKIKRAEGVAMEPFRSLLTRDRRTPLPDRVVVQSFEPASDASAPGPFDAMPIMTGPQGEVVVVRRIVGAGAVTLIGLDLAHAKLRDNAAVFQADHFWHRVLGKRLALPTPKKLDEDMKGGPGGKSTPAWAGTRTDALFDVSFARLIAKSGSAAAGVLLGLAVFAAYWLVAGPLGFFALRKKGMVQHAWVSFVAAIALFTAVAWGGASALKTRRVEGQHLTIVDGVYGQSTQRARTFVSLFLPRYGEQRVRIETTSAGGGAVDESVHNALAPWEPPPEAGGAGFSAFPDARGYPVNSRAPDEIYFPARATVKQVQGEWLGALPGSWSLPVPAAASGVPVGGEIRLVPREEPITAVSDRTGPGRKWAVDGTISHNLPGPLKDVYVVLVRSGTMNFVEPGQLPFEAFVVTLPEWPAATPQAIDRWFDRPLSSLRAEKALEDLLGKPRGFGNVMGDDVAVDPNRRLIALSLFSVLKTATRVDSGPDTPWFRARRQSMHSYDLSRWFTQPCLIVMGVLEDSDLPVPMSVDAQGPGAISPRVRGKTLVRWVYPLAPEPIRADPSRGAPDSSPESDVLPPTDLMKPDPDADKLPGE